MKLLLLDGTPEEISQLLPTLQQYVEPAQGIHVPADEKKSSCEFTNGLKDNENFYPVSVNHAKRVLSRIPLSNEQKTVLRSIYNAYPDKVSAKTLQNKIGYSAKQFSGLMGAFGRRVSHTPGVSESEYFFDQDWNGEEGWSYGFPESVREAISLKGADWL